MSTKGKNYWIDNWNGKKYLLEMMQEGKINMQIIGWFGTSKDYSFDNYEQMQHFISRNRRTADRLTCYPLKRIIGTFDYLKENATEYKWTLETVEKYILEDKLQKGEVIITLSTNEKVYDTKRIEELEQQGRIYWNNTKWIERKDKGSEQMV